MTMPKDVEYGGERPEDKSPKQGKSGNSFANDLFASIENFFYEFGLISKPNANAEKREESKQDHKLKQQDQHQPGDYEPSGYLGDEEVLLSQENKIGQQYWQDQVEGESGYSDTHIEV